MKLTVLLVTLALLLCIQPASARSTHLRAYVPPHLGVSAAGLERRGFWHDLGEAAKDFFGQLGSAIKDGAETVADAFKRHFGHAAEEVIDFVLPEALEDLPLPERVQSFLGNDAERTDHLPLRVLNLPNYGNWTEGGWTLRIRAVVYKQPDVPPKKLAQWIAHVLGKHGDVGDSPDLSPHELENVRNTTASIFISQRYQRRVSFDVARKTFINGSDVLGRSQVVKHPQASSTMGDIDDFVFLRRSDIVQGNTTTHLQRLRVVARDAELGETESWLVPPTGLTVLSDLDDVIKETVIWHPIKGALVNTFVKPDKPWMNMPEVLANWSHRFADLHFHYLSLTPEQLSRTTLQFLQKLYPAGSLDMRPMTKEGIGLGARTNYMRKIFESFPHRKFVLLGDTSTAELLKSYGAVVKERPDQLQCMFIRNDSATDGPKWKPFDTGFFRGINESKVMFFRTPDDLLGLDIMGGECLNRTFSQNLTYSMQNVPGLSDEVAEDIFEALPFLKWFIDMM